MYISNISTEELQELEYASFPGKICVVDSVGTEFKKAVNYIRSQKIIGFDTETRPCFSPDQPRCGVALLQLSGPEKAYLFRIKHIGMDRRLCNILSSDKIIKVGAAVNDDIKGLQKYRNEAPARVMSKVTDEEGRTTSEVIRVGKGGDYASLDALVMDATNNLIEPWYQEDPDLVVIVGRQLLADKYFPIVNKEQDNSEMLAADVIISQKRIGNLPAVRVPYFPADAMLITKLENLSIYYMDDSHRRVIEENPKLDRVENYESMNIDYVVEDYAAGCLVEKIKVGDFSTPAKATAEPGA